jgi:hypothetical protein
MFGLINPRYKKILEIRETENVYVEALEDMLEGFLQKQKDHIGDFEAQHRIRTDAAVAAFHADKYLGVAWQGAIDRFVRKNGGVGAASIRDVFNRRMIYEDARASSQFLTRSTGE